MSHNNQVEQTLKKRLEGMTVASIRKEIASDKKKKKAMVGYSSMKKNNLIQAYLKYKPNQPVIKQKRAESSWSKALRLWNSKKGSYCIPKKGSDEYKEVRKLMENKTDKLEKKKKEEKHNPTLKNVKGKQETKKITVKDYKDEIGADKWSTVMTSVFRIDNDSNQWHFKNEKNEYDDSIQSSDFGIMLWEKLTHKRFREAFYENVSPQSLLYKTTKTLYKD